MKTSLKAIEERDRDHLASRRLADVMISLLRDYIPRVAKRDAWHMLAETAFEQKFELTNFAMRKEYEAWKGTQLDMLGMGTGTLKMNDDGSVERVDPKDLLSNGLRQTEE